MVPLLAGALAVSIAATNLSFLRSRTSVSSSFSTWLSKFFSSDSFYEEAKVLQIYDGDTILVEFKGRREKVRFIGIDAPESSESAKARRDAARLGVTLQELFVQGVESTKYLKTLMQRGDEINLEFDTQERDKYGRMLAYIHTLGKKSINEEMLRAGYASLMIITPDNRYQQKFLNQCETAKKQKRGLWKEERPFLTCFIWS